MRHPALPALALLGNALVWGLSWIGFKALNQQGLHPLWTTVLVNACALAALLLWRPGSLRGFGRHPQLLALAAVAGATNVGFNWAVTIGDVVRVVLLFYLMPLWSIGLAWLLLGERPTRGALLRLLLALAGVALVLWRPGLGLPLPADMADGLALLAGFCFALNNVLLRRWRDTPDEARVLAMFGGVLVIAAGLAVALRVSWSMPSAVSAWLPWAAGLALAFLGGNLALQYSTARLPAHAASLIMLSEVLFASLSAVLLGAAAPSARTWAGGLLIVLAALLAVRPRRAG